MDSTTLALLRTIRDEADDFMPDLTDEIDAFWEDVYNLPDAGVKVALADFVRHAVLTEREACAQVAEREFADREDTLDDVLARIASTIRARPAP